MSKTRYEFGDVDLELNFTTKELSDEMQEEAQKAIQKASEVILADAQYYIRMDTGDLRKSVRISPVKDGFKIVWNTPYAKRVYYTGTPSKDVNPNASLQWAHKAYSIHGTEWQKAINNLLEDL